MLPTRTKIHYSYPILDNGISSFGYYSSGNHDRLHDQHYSSEPSSSSVTAPSYLQNQASNLRTIVKTEADVSLKPPFIKRILIVDDDPDIILTFKAGLDCVYYGNDDKKKKFEVYTYNDPLLVLKEFKPLFYDLLLSDIYMPNLNGFQLCQKILELDINLRVCFMSASRVNIQALREQYPNVSFGCFIEKPVSIKYLFERLTAELD